MVDHPKRAGGEPASKPEAPDLKKRVQIHPVWWALGLVIVGVGGTVGVMKFIDDHITEQVALKIEPQVIEVLDSNPELARLRDERRQAADALENGTRSEQQATTKFAMAIEQSENAIRAAKETTAAADQLKNIADISQLGSKLDAALAEPKFRQQVIDRVLPTGAVIAFDASNGCPEGWAIFDKAGEEPSWEQVHTQI